MNDHTSLEHKQEVVWLFVLDHTYLHDQAGRRAGGKLNNKQIHIESYFLMDISHTPTLYLDWGSAILVVKVNGMEGSCRLLILAGFLEREE